MKKTISKIISLALVLIMSVCVMSACGSNSSMNSGSSNSDKDIAGKEDYTIGVIIWSTDDGLGADSKKALDAVAEDLGINLIYRTGGFDAEAQITDIENLISAGVDGILMVPLVDSSIDEYMKVCEDANIPLQLCFRNIIDKEAYDYCMNSDLFAGYVCEDEVSAGKAMVDQLLAEGCTTIGLLNGDAANSVTATRQNGYMEYLKELGVTYYETTVTTGDTASTMVDAVDKLLAAHSDINGFISVTGSYGAIDAIVTDLEGSDIKLTCFDTPADIKGSFELGNMCMLTTGTQIDPVYALINLYCFLTGQPKSETPLTIESKYIYMTSVEDAENYQKYFSEFNTYTAEEIQELVSMDKDAFVQEVGSYSLQKVIDKMK